MKNTDPRFDLIRRCHDGEASPEELALLEAHLREDTTFRNVYVRYVRTDRSLSRIAISRPEAKTVPIRSANFTSSWRWLTGMAAGLVLGMFTTSLIFAFTERASTMSTRVTKLVDAGNGQKRGRIPSGVPTDFGVWSGDESEIVNGNTSDAPPALRFVRAERESMLASAGAGSCDVYKLIDLSELKAKSPSGEAALSLSVQFRDARPSEGETVRFIARIYAFSGTPDSLKDNWPLNRSEALAKGFNQVESRGGAPHSKIRLTANVFLPPQGDFALVHLIVNKPDFNAPESVPATFGEQFIEDVQFTITTQLNPPPSVTRN